MVRADLDLSFRGGRIHIPRQRRLADWSKILFCLMMNACFSTSRLVSGRARLIGSDSGFFARQNFFTGQIPHFGLVGTQMSAPRSSKAELWTAEELFETREAAFSQSCFRPAVESIGVRKSKRRDTTREVFASI